MQKGGGPQTSSILERMCRPVSVVALISELAYICTCVRVCAHVMCESIDHLLLYPDNKPVK